MNREKQSINKLALLGTIHDVQGKNYELFNQYFSLLEEVYDEIYITVSDSTNKRYLELIRSRNYNIKIIPKKGAANARCEVVKFGLTNSSISHFHYCDFDRVLVWVRNNLNELRELRKKFFNVDYMIVGRTEKAFLTHPLSWQETERLTNKLLSMYLGKNVDVTAGSCGFSREVAKLIVENSCEKVTDGEWPIIAYKYNKSVEYIDVDGLEYLVEYNGSSYCHDEKSELLGRIELCNKICRSIADTWDKF